MASAMHQDRKAVAGMEKGAYYEEHAGLFPPGLPAIFRHYELWAGERNDFLHWHEGVELFWGTGGEGWVFCDGHRLRLTEDRVVIINSGQLHRAQAETPHLEYEYLILEKELWEEISPDFTVWFSCQEREGDQRLKLLMAEAAAERDELREYGWLGVKGQLLRIMSHLLEEYGAQPRETAYSMEGGGRMQMYAALSFLKEHYREEITVEQVSRIAGYSQSHFSRMFRKMSGMTMMEYVNMLRCDSVRRLLLTQDCSIGQAVELSGFTNRALFYRMYRRFIGHLPAEEKRAGREILKEKSGKGNF